eukprot:TRINITY_DN25335_c0_g1_i1.p2 TRINITY_DN25335_c0_g1~~TRINITY_DN25335_c0_g1_i1.p2  ORF type:complete len:164 (+),score=49.22 TRINITY_DN25335_c0_g1_i1:75-566(+)
MAVSQGRSVRRRPGGLVAAAVALAVAASTFFDASLLQAFTAPAAASRSTASVVDEEALVALRVPSAVARGSGRTDHTALAAAMGKTARMKMNKKMIREMKKRRNEEWQQPFPKWAVGGMCFFGILGYIGGGTTLACVWAFCGFAFGYLFEPYKTREGDIAGFY